MPGMTGLQAASAVRDINADQAVLLMSGYSQDLLAPGEDRIAPLLTKPFAADALLAAVDDATMQFAAPDGVAAPARVVSMS
jgi:CheY-like chemotaxis protein